MAQKKVDLDRISSTVSPITLELALSFRDMSAWKGERQLTPSRAGWLANITAGGLLETMFWGCIRYKGMWYRANGQHTSNLLVACIQMTKNGELDDRSTEFFSSLTGKGKTWRGETESDLPSVQEGQYRAFIETKEASTASEVETYFRRWDARQQTRTARHELGITIGGYGDLDGLPPEKISTTIGGTIRAAKLQPRPFDVADRKLLLNNSTALQIDRIRECTRWIIESVPDAHLYKHVAGSQFFAELWISESNEELRDAIVEQIVKDIDDNIEPTRSWYNSLNERRNKPTPESIAAKGRKVLKNVRDRVRESVEA